MAPPLPRALSRAQGKQSSAAMNTLIRSFSSTSLRQATQIPPESPMFINVPTPPLSQAVEDQHISPLARKGHLPVPRSIFRGKRRTVMDKRSQEFLEKSAPRATTEKSKRPPQDEAMAWRRRMADVRRTNLEEGIEGLWKRRVQMRETRKQINLSKLERNDRSMKAPQRRDERLTETSVPAELLDTVVRRDPERFKVQLDSKQRTEQLLAKKSDDRKNALIQLYMEARKFIVTEEDLEKRVEQEFKDDIFETGTSSFKQRGTSIWDAKGVPMTVRDMMSNMSAASNKVIRDDDTSQNNKRQQRIAEKLTGGPLPEKSSKDRPKTGTVG